MAIININKECGVQIKIKKSETPITQEQERQKVEVQVNELPPKVIVKTKPQKIAVVIDDNESVAAIDATAAAKEARDAAGDAIKGAELAIEQAAYAKEMGDLAKEIIDGNVHHEITEEEANKLMDEIDNEDGND